MQVNVLLTKTELEEMQVTPEQLKQGIIEALDGGIGIKHEETLYLSGFNVDVQVTD